jgi:hypothetical protein
MTQALYAHMNNKIKKKIRWEHKAPEIFIRLILSSCYSYDDFQKKTEIKTKSFDVNGPFKFYYFQNSNWNHSI